MTVKLKKIGNSRGLIIPKKVLEMCGLNEEVVMTVEEGHIIISPVNEPRANWEKQFSDADLKKDEVNLFENISNDFDDTEWTW